MQTSVIDQLVGQTLGSCQVEQLLGRGRLSAVYLAHQPAYQQRTVALTAFIIPEQFSAQARSRFLIRFSQEAAVLTTLKHRNILSVYEYGEQFGFPYLVTPYVTEGSLAKTLKQQGRFTPIYTYELLQQIASALDYIHSQGVMHGALKPANILLKSDKTIQVAGFGLVRILEMRGIEQLDHPQGHLMSIAGTFLGAPEYIAPEFVQGQPLSARSDVYALGMMLFELLSGKLPFTGANPLEVAAQHVQKTVPALHVIRPDLPIALGAVINQALARDPAQRFRSAGELATAFGEVLRGTAPRIPAAPSVNAPLLAGDETQDWQLKPPVITGSLPAMKKALPGSQPVMPTPLINEDTGSWQLLPPIITGKLPSVQPSPEPVAPPPPAPVVPRTPWSSMEADRATASPKTPWSPKSPAPQGTGVAPQLPQQPPSKGSETNDVDPFEWWSNTFSGQLVLPDPGVARSQSGKYPTPAADRGTSGKYPVANADRFNSGRLAAAPVGYPMPSSRPSRRIVPGAKKKQGLSRRNAIALLAGGVVAAGVIGYGGVSLAHILNKGNTTTTANTGTGGTTPQQSNTPSTTGVTPQPTQKPNPQPTPKAGTTPTQVAHTGTVIGHTNQQANTAQKFNNPADGQGSLLIRLPGGNFVAYEQACTHEGVTVNYDPNTHTLICPAHGAIFDPTNGAQVLQGPATTPLASVTIKVNTDGTITVG